MRRSLISVLLFSVTLILTLTSTPVPQAEVMVPNFEIDLSVQAGSRLHEEIALYLKSNLAQIGIGVNVITKPLKTLVNDALHLTSNEFDLLLIGFAGGGIRPSFNSFYHSTSNSGSTSDSSSIYTTPNENIETPDVQIPFSSIFPITITLAIGVTIMRWNQKRNQ